MRKTLPKGLSDLSFPTPCSSEAGSRFALAKRNAAICDAFDAAANNRLLADCSKFKQ
jgi:hypothetical protein